MNRPKLLTKRFRTLVFAGPAMPKLKSRPSADDIKASETLIDDATGKADTAVGRQNICISGLRLLENSRGRDLSQDLQTDATFPVEWD